MRAILALVVAAVACSSGPPRAEPPPAPAPSPPPACAPTFAPLMDGAPCETDGARCAYPGGVCACAMRGLCGRGATSPDVERARRTLVWDCAPPSTSGCPAP